MRSDSLSGRALPSPGGSQVRSLHRPPGSRCEPPRVHDAHDPSTRKKPKGAKLSLRAIAAELEAQGHLNEGGSAQRGARYRSRAFPSAAGRSCPAAITISSPTAPSCPCATASGRPCGATAIGRSCAASGAARATMRKSRTAAMPQVDTIRALDLPPETSVRSFAAVRAARSFSSAWA